ncbi:MAG: S8 family serine peptidase [bacterium]
MPNGFGRSASFCLNSIITIVFIFTFSFQSVNLSIFKRNNPVPTSITKNADVKTEKTNRLDKVREVALNNQNKYESTSENKSTEVSTKSENIEFLPGKLILKVSPGTDLNPTQITEKTGLNKVSVQKLTETSLIISSPDLTSGAKTNTPISEVNQKTKDTLENLQKIKGVLSSELDLVYKRDFATNDPFINDLYHLNNTGQNGGVTDQDVDAFEAWDVQTGSNQIIIAVVDDGMDVDHPDLAPNMLLNSSGKVIGYDFVNNDDDTDVVNPPADWGHGTHVAGTIAARGNNGIGVSGVCQTCKIMPVKVLDDTGSGSLSSVAQGIIFAADNGAKIINLSLGGGKSSLIEDAINYAYSKGVLSVASAGNSSSSNPSYPAAFENSVSVASLKKDGTKSDFSNFGSTVDISAYGSEIISTFPIGASLDAAGCSDANFSLPNDGYGFCSGTSMAAPVVSGVAGLILSQNPGLSVTDLRSVLLGFTDDVETLNPAFKGKLGSGSVNAYKALNGLNSYLVSMKTLPIIDQNLNGVAELNEAVQVPIKFNSSSFSPNTLTNVKLNFISNNPQITITSPQPTLINDLAPGSTIDTSLSFTSSLSTNPGLVEFTIELQSDQYNKTYYYSLDVIKKLQFSDANFTFDTDSQGWYTSNSNWKLAQNCSQMTSSPKYWHFGGNNCADYTENQSGTLKSPAILLPLSDSTYINFDQYLDNEHDSFIAYDSANVLIKIVGQNDAEALPISTPCSFFSSSLCGQNTFENVSFEIPSYYGGKNVQFLFEFTSDNVTNRAGWYIDNVSLQNIPLVQQQLTNVLDDNNNKVIEANEIVELEYTYHNKNTISTANVEPSFNPTKNISFLSIIPPFELLPQESKIFTVRARVANQIKAVVEWSAYIKVNNYTLPNPSRDNLKISPVINLPLDDDLSNSQFYDLGNSFDIYGNSNWHYTNTKCANIAGNNGQIYFGAEDCSELPVSMVNRSVFGTSALIPSSNKNLELIIDQYIDTQSDIPGLIDATEIFVYSYKLGTGFNLQYENTCLIEDPFFGNFQSQCPKAEWHKSKFTIPQEVIDNGPFDLTFSFSGSTSNGRVPDTYGWFINSIKIQETNLPPVIAVNPLILTANVDQPISFNLKLEAKISDPENDILNLNLGTPSKGGQVVFNSTTGKYIYTPKTQFQGTETISYTVTDIKGNITNGAIEFIIGSSCSASSSSSISSSSLSSITSSSNSSGLSSSSSTSLLISSSASSITSSLSSVSSSIASTSSTNSLISSSVSSISSSSSSCSSSSSISSSSSSSISKSTSSSVKISISSRSSIVSPVVENSNNVSAQTNSISSLSSSNSSSQNSVNSSSSQSQSKSSSQTNTQNNSDKDKSNQKCENQNLFWMPTTPVIILVITLIIMLAAMFLISFPNARMLAALLGIVGVITSSVFYITRNDCQNGWWIVGLLTGANIISAFTCFIRNLK